MTRLAAHKSAIELHSWHGKRQCVGGCIRQSTYRRLLALLEQRIEGVGSRLARAIGPLPALNHLRHPAQLTQRMLTQDDPCGQTEQPAKTCGGGLQGAAKTQGAVHPAGTKV